MSIITTTTFFLQDAMHGMVLKWAVDAFVTNVHMIMTGSHSIVTEQCKNMQFEKNLIDGSWNKGKVEMVTSGTANCGTALLYETISQVFVTWLFSGQPMEI
ncbi:MAG: hypothetical protein AAGJ35_10190 [Myxococcota bacterium]